MPSLADALRPEGDPFAGMSPMDALKLRQELAAKYPVSPQQASQNRATTLKDALSVTPVIGQAMSAYDAGQGAGQAYDAFSQGDIKKGALATALTALSGVGAVTGLPWGKAAGDVASEAGRTLNIFAGPTAKTADHAALAKAQELAGAGANRDDVWNQTGWFTGPDGKWRFEIDDSGAQLAGVTALDKPSLFGRRGEPTSATFSGLDHRALDEAYGQSPMIYGKYGPGITESGSHIPSADPNFAPYLEVQGPTSQDARSIALHERQHDIQGREGFANGGQLTGPEDYRRLAGEVEARNVQSRMNMTAAERRAKAPWLTQDVPDDQQIVRYR